MTPSTAGRLLTGHPGDLARLSRAVLAAPAMATFDANGSFGQRWSRVCTESSHVERTGMPSSTLVRRAQSSWSVVWLAAAAGEDLHEGCSHARRVLELCGRMY